MRATVTFTGIEWWRVLDLEDARCDRGCPCAAIGVDLGEHSTAPGVGEGSRHMPATEQIAGLRSNVVVR